jgi:hypothetical protein
MFDGYTCQLSECCRVPSHRTHERTYMHVRLSSLTLACPSSLNEVANTFLKKAVERVIRQAVPFCADACSPESRRPG